MKYSIVIPTYNRSQSVIQTLDSVVNQTISPDQYEIIIIDDGSTDDTESRVTKYKLQITKPQIKYFKIEHGGPAKARNVGIKESKGGIIFFTDDDCVVPKNWMETLLGGYRRYPDVVGVGGWYKPIDKNLSKKYFQKYLDYFPNYKVLETENKSDNFYVNLAGNTANMSYKKSILEDVGGFDENLYFAGAVDWELKKNIQNKKFFLLYVPLMVGHFKNYNLINFAKKSFNQGRGRYYMTLKYPKLIRNNNYNINFYNALKKISDRVGYERKFISAHIINVFFMFLGQLYVKYLKPWPIQKPPLSTQ